MTEHVASVRKKDVTVGDALLFDTGRVKVATMLDDPDTHRLNIGAFDVGYMSPGTAERGHVQGVTALSNLKGVAHGDYLRTGDDHVPDDLKAELDVVVTTQAACEANLTHELADLRAQFGESRVDAALSNALEADADWRE